MTDKSAEGGDIIKAKPIENEEGLDDADYTPNFIDKLLRNPALLPLEYREDFETVFSHFEHNHLGRAKTALEFILVSEATKLVLNLERYDRMKSAIFLNQQRSAVEMLLRKTHEGAAMQDVGPMLHAVAHLEAQQYFNNSAYKAQANSTFQGAGYAPDAVEGETFLRALPAHALIEKLIASAQKRLFGILKDLEARYANRDPEEKPAGAKRKTAR